ncbi:MAG: hypothetical protein QOF09_1750 [Alphaproteobacteria bacterium]|nr:hypothetical protein [Alphaproteobacteria bacterium]
MSPRVLAVAHRLEIGGTEMHLTRVLPELRRHGIDISVFVLARGGRLERQLVGKGVDVIGPAKYRARLIQDIAACFSLRRELGRRRPDIVHYFLPEPYLVGSLAAAGTNVVRIMSRRSLADYQIDHPILARFERWLHRFTTGLIGNSTAVVRQLVGECGNASKVGLIHNGIEMPPAITAERRMAARDKFGIPADAFVLAVSANFMAYKGHDDLFDALGLMARKPRPPWRLMLIGRDEGHDEKLRIKAAALGFASNILWLNECDDAQTPLDAADIGVLPSHQEGFSNSLLEKMARGLAVIATRVGGNVDAVIDGESGLLVPVKDPPALMAAIVELWENGELRARLGSAARDRVQKSFSLDACVQKYLNLFDGIARRENGPIENLIGSG